MAARPSILIIDDNEAFLEQFVPFFLEGTDYDVTTLTSAKKALDQLEAQPADLIVSDVHMPDMSGLEFFRRAQELYSEIPVIFVTAFGCMEQAIELVKQGAFQYFEKPVVDRMDLFHAAVREALAKRTMLKNLASLTQEKSLRSRASETIMGQSAEIRKVLHSIEEVSSLPVTVLISGETGTGKDLVARAIHESSDRRDKCFYPVNCSEFAEGVLESELFGHEMGSFTGAIGRRKGLFEVADQGTLFLDEISEASPALQSKLLRVIETKTFTRVGGTSPVHSDFRLLVATNRNLEKMVAGGGFRQDLLYRLNIYSIEVPPLRNRKEDIPILAEYYLRRFARKYRRHVESISIEAMLFLREYRWPGNVRELVNAMERAVISCRNNLITLDHLPIRLDTRDCAKTQNMNLNDAEKFVIGMALKRAHGNRVQAAELLGINRTTLSRKIQVYGLNGPDEITET